MKKPQRTFFEQCLKEIPKAFHSLWALEEKPADREHLKILYGFFYEVAEFGPTVSFNEMVKASKKLWEKLYLCITVKKAAEPDLLNEIRETLQKMTDQINILLELIYLIDNLDASKQESKKICV